MSMSWWRWGISQKLFRRRHEPVVSWLAVLLLLLITTACSGHITLPPLPVLDQPGVTPVPGFDRFLHNLPGEDKERLEQLTAYQPHDATQPAHALMVIGGGLYDPSLDGAIAHNVPTQYACQDRPAVTPDGRWLMCAAAPGAVALDLQTPALNNWQVALLDATGTASFSGPHPRLAAWGPDSSHFVVDMDAPDGCVLGLYVADPPFKEAQLVTQLTFPSLAPDCDIEDVGWSPDGKWLAFIAQLPVGVGATNQLFALDLRAIPLPQNSATDANRAIAVPSSALNDLGGAGETLTWSATSQAISMAGYESIFEVDLLTRERHIVLAQKEVQFCTASWTPDGATLVFILCNPRTSNPDVASAPLAQLYTDTPDPATHP